MADNFAFSAGTGLTGAADDIGGVLYARVKVTWGVDGVATDTSAANPLPVVQTGTLNAVVTNAGTFATQSAITAASGSIASGAISSGAIASGAVASGAYASGAFASGAFASGSIAAGAIAAGATSIAANEDDASNDLDRGVKFLAVRKATPANTSGTDGDYEFLQMSAGRLWVDNSGVTTTVSGTVTANQGGTWTVQPGNTANTTAWLTTDSASKATGGAVPSMAGYMGMQAITALPSAATATNLVGLSADKFGRAITVPVTVRDLVGTQTTTISASTSETTIVTAAASTFNDLVMLIISNTSASTTTRIDFRDTTAGTILFSLTSIGGQPPVGFVLPVPIPQTTVNTNWTAQCSASTTDVRVYAVFAKNK